MLCPDRLDFSFKVLHLFANVKEIPGSIIVGGRVFEEISFVRATLFFCSDRKDERIIPGDLGWGEVTIFEIHFLNVHVFYEDLIN